MRYLKTFENLDDREEDVEYLDSLINDYLAYLLDDGYSIFSNYVKPNSSTSVYKNSGSREDYYYISLWKKSSDPNKVAYFNFNDIEDDIIPFIELMQTKGYKFTDCEFTLYNFKTDGRLTYSADSLLNSTTEPDINFFKLKQAYFNFKK
jgi:hypothetical protein